MTLSRPFEFGLDLPNLVPVDGFTLDEIFPSELKKEMEPTTVTSPQFQADLANCENETFDSRVRRRPQLGRALTVTYVANVQFQICGIEPGRHTVMIFNSTQSLTCAFYVNGLFNDENFTIAANSSFSIDVEDQLYGMATAAGTVQVVRTLYDIRKIAFAKLTRKQNGN